MAIDHCVSCRLIPSKEELPSILVQEIAHSRADVPDRYIHKNGFPQASDSAAAAASWMDTLTVDFSLLSSSSSPSPLVEHELIKFQRALEGWGCFQAVNHGITSSMMEELIGAGKQFFALPLDEKLKYCSEDDIASGYGNSACLSANEILNWHDRLYLGLHPEGHRKLKFWPEKPENLREILDEVTKGLRKIVEVMFKAMARSLNLEENCFLNQIGKDPLLTAKFSMYPPCPKPDHVLGARPHIDGSILTIVLQDNQVEGLQVLKDDQWIQVPVIPGAFFINLGEFGEMMTNGKMKAVMHRVVTNPQKGRLSLAVFCRPKFEDEIGPVNELVNVHSPQLYKRMSALEYRKLFFENYPRSALELVKMK